MAAELSETLSVPRSKAPLMPDVLVKMMVPVCADVSTAAPSGASVIERAPAFGTSTVQVVCAPVARMRRMTKRPVVDIPAMPLLPDLPA